MNDIRFAFRQLLKHPGFTAVAVLTLALGIGANTAIFSVVNAVLLRRAPYKDPDRLVWIWENNLAKKLSINPVSPGNYTHWRNQNHVFEGLSAWDGQSFNLIAEAEPEHVSGLKVFANFFDVLGVKPLLGRTFAPEEDRAGADRVALVSQRLWRQRFGGDTNIVGKTVSLDGKNFTIIGVVPAEQGVPFNHFDVWLPFALEESRMQNHADRSLRVIGRLKPGITIKQAQAEMDTIARRLATLFPADNNGAGIHIIALREMFAGEMRAPLFILLGAVAFVLLIGCANVANLMLGRAAARRKEIALRAALGASRFRLIRQALTESFLICGLGAAAGLAVAVYGVQSLAALVPTVSNIYKVAIPGVDQIRLDTPVLLFTMALTFVTAFLCGLAPALGSSRPDLNQSLKEGSRSSTGGLRSGRFRNGLVIAEVALALMLLIGAGLMIQSFGRLREVSLGFNPRNLLTMTLSLPELKYPERSQRAGFYQELLQRVGALPGVKSAGLAGYLPLSGHWGTVSFSIEGRPPMAPGDFLVADVDSVSPSYFPTMETPLIQGRNFAESDREKAPQVVIINEAMARRFWPNENPLGQRLNLGNANKPDLWQVIGVVGDVKQFGQDREAGPKIFASYLQDAGKWMSLVVRSAGNPVGLVGSIRTQVLAIDKAQPVFEIQTFDQLVSQTIAPRRFVMLLLGIFAIVALLLATIGIYGVIAYAVRKRTHEIGVRMALGAQGTDVLALVLKQGLILTLIGLAVGLAGSLALSRIISSQLYQVKATDPLIYSFVALALTAVALIACVIPARRATKVDPMEALRYE